MAKSSDAEGVAGVLHAGMPNLRAKRRSLG